MRRALIALACALGATLCGCGTGGGNGAATLTIYVSAPLRGPLAAQGRAAAAGAREELRRAGSEAGGPRVRAFYLDDSGGRGLWSMAAASGNARRAAEDHRTVGYIGELDPRATRFSRPITDEAGIAQVSFPRRRATVGAARSFGRRAMAALIGAIRRAGGAERREAVSAELRSDAGFRATAGYSVNAP